MVCVVALTPQLPTVIQASPEIFLLQLELLTRRQREEVTHCLCI